MLIRLSQHCCLSKSYVQTPRASLTLDGTVSQSSALNVRLQANDLHELETVAAIFSPPTEPLNLRGTASFDGTVRGSTRHRKLPDN